jgi:fumarate hydratase subunit beta
MDDYTPLLLSHGLKGMIGKGCRDQAVYEAIKKYNAVYFAAVGGLGALLSKSIIKSEIIAYEELGTEAIRKLEIKDFPAVVACDTKGRNLYS